MTDDSRRKYQPHLPSDKNYLNKIANQIKTKNSFENIPFENLNTVLSSLGITADPYQLVTLSRFNPPSLQKLTIDSFTALQNIDSGHAVWPSIFRLWDYLAEGDSLIASDLIFVFSGQGQDRVSQAIRLFKDGFAPKILFSGRRPSYMTDNLTPESEYYTRIALDQGISPDHLIIENQSINTVENVVFSTRIMAELKFNPKIIILLTNSFHMRRAYLTFKNHYPKHARLLRHPVAAEKYNRDNFFRDRDGWAYVFNEYIKLYGARLMKHF